MPPIGLRDGERMRATGRPVVAVARSSDARGGWHHGDDARHAGEPGGVSATEDATGRVPVLVGISDTAFIESVNLADYAADAGAQAVVLAPAYYFPMGQAELQQYVAHIAAELPLPLMLYNIPSHTKVRFELDTVRRLMEIPKIAGIKDSTADMIFFHHLCQLAAERDDWAVFMGPEELLGDAVLSGGHGGVCGGANLFPRLYVDLYHAAERRDMDQVAQLRARVLWIAKSFYTIARHGAAVTAALKCALRCLEICDDFMAEPFQRLTDRQRAAIQTYLAEGDLRSYLPSARCRQERCSGNKIKGDN